MKIAYGNSRMEKKWKNNDISWDDFCKRVSTTQTTTETVEEYRKMTKPQQDSIKDVGGFRQEKDRDGALPFYADAGYGPRYAGCPG